MTPDTTTSQADKNKDQLHQYLKKNYPNFTGYDQFKHDDSDYVYEVITNDGLTIDNVNGNEKYLFRRLYPAQEEGDLGFVRGYHKGICKDCYIISEKTNNKLSLAKSILHNNFNDKDSNKHGYFSTVDSVSKQQARYLINKVQGQENTTDDPKVGLHSSVKELEAAIDSKDDNTAVKIANVSYFDGLITHEAFRSSLLQRIHNDNEKTVAANLTNSFPIRTFNEQVFLSPMPISNISNHIGITTIAITLDKKIVIFKQGQNQVIGSGSYVASGSGSMDAEDINCSNTESDLLFPIKYAMARELAEESGVDMEKEKENKAQITQFAQSTYVTGFFRWVNRCGKPEFVGVTKLTAPLTSLKAMAKK